MASYFLCGYEPFIPNHTYTKSVIVMYVRILLDYFQKHNAGTVEQRRIIRNYLKRIDDFDYYPDEKEQQVLLEYFS